jgi:ADP-ribose pyrophosphatase YjhB (NUDIX family)
MEWIKRLRAAIGSELTFVISAGAWIEDADGSVLLQRRAAAGSVWGLPGGIMELGEAAHETAIREVREETGLEVEVDALLGVYSKYYEKLHNGDQCQCVSIIYKMSVCGGKLRIDNNETYELRYFGHNEIPNLHTEMHRQIVTDVLSGSGPFLR